jgi:hypothetical protein
MGGIFEGMKMGSLKLFSFFGDARLFRGLPAPATMWTDEASTHG